MTSEVNTLGATPLEIKGELKAFGVSSSNLTPSADGIAPLSKQNSFKKEETVNLNVQNPTPTPAPVQETPITVANPSGLEGFAMPEINIPILDEKAQTVEEPKVADIPMPTIPNTILAQEPTGVNENLFANGNTPASTVDTPAQTVNNSPVSVPQETQVSTPDKIEETPALVNPMLQPAQNEETKKTEEKKPEVVENTNQVDVNIDKMKEISEFAKKLVEEYKASVEKMMKDIDAIAKANTEEFMKKLEEIPVLIDNMKENITLSDNIKDDKVEMANQNIEPIHTELNLSSMESTPTPTPNPTPVPLEPMPTAMEQNLNPSLPTLETTAPLEKSEPTAIPQETINELPTLETAMKTVPALEAAVKEVDNTPAPVPAPQVPLNQPAPVSQNQTQGPVFPPAEHDNLVEDAFSQIRNMQIPGVDNTPIQGKFL